MFLFDTVSKVWVTCYILSQYKPQYDKGLSVQFLAVQQVAFWNV